MLPLITLEFFGNHVIVSFAGVIAIRPLGYCINSRRPSLPFPLPGPLSPTIAIVPSFNRPSDVVLTWRLILCVPVDNLGILGKLNLEPTQFKPLIRPFKPFLIALTMPPI